MPYTSPLAVRCRRAPWIRGWLVIMALIWGVAPAACGGRGVRIRDRGGAAPPRTISRPRPTGESTSLFTSVQTGNRRRLVLSDSQLAKIGLQQRWVSEFPGKRIEGVYLLGETIYVSTHDHFLYAVDVRDGVVRWVFEVGDELSFRPSVFYYPPQPEGSPPVYDEVFLISKDRLLAVDREIGALQWKTVLPFTPASPPSASETHVYVGSWDERVYAISKQDHVVTWPFRTDGHIVAAGISARSGARILYYFASEDGDVYGVEATTGKRVWSRPFHTLDPILADLTMYRQSLYVGSTDYNVYCLSPYNGLEEWRTETGAPVRQSPVGVLHTVYAVSDRNALFAIHRIRGDRPDGTSYRAGAVKWTYPGGVLFLGRGEEKAYLLDSDKNVCAVDEETGTLRWKYPFPEVDYFCVNQANLASDLPDPKERDAERDRAGNVFLGFRNGWLVCLKERPRY